MSGVTAGARIQVRGTVQGVGFRPFVYALATRFQMTGWVRNTSHGVEIEINGDPDRISDFVTHLRLELPPLAKIDSLESQPVEPNGYTTFRIEASQAVAGDFLPVSPDVATCPDCLRELFDPTDRRYRYPFINCTNCGPRFTIVRDIPYDRPNTTMDAFPMCDDCRAEYENPLDRRFHAQPVACPVCGPKIWMQADGKRVAEREDALQLARRWLKKGKILAVKGLGGFHLACDATNAAAVDRLRARKLRSDKPFALMAFDLEEIERHCEITPAERTLLESKERPVVLLQRRSESPIVRAVAPNLGTLGFMLPYTPLHTLLLKPGDDAPSVLVMTSGNLSEEPIAFRDEDAVERLANLADAFLLHDRPIHMRVDDSVATVVEEQPYLLRRARGYAPQPIRLAHSVRPILATGAELKNTFCLTRQEYAFLSHHIGDLENYETLRSFEEGIEHYERLFRVQPEVIACDLHPDYLATRYARERSGRENLPVIAVQHHHAHLAACLADNDWTRDEPVIGLIFDGTGLGTDGAVWGGEVLVGGYTNFQRRFHLKYVPLPGGDQAVRKPARMALAHLWAAGILWEPDLPPVDALCYEERTTLRAVLEHRLNAPPTSSMGRLFDAAAALIGLRPSVTYEAQAAIEMEALVDPRETHGYEFSVQGDEIDPAPMWEALLADWRAGEKPTVLTARFHNSVVNLSVQLCRQIRAETGINAVALSGGVWQNLYLLERVLAELRQDRFEVMIHHRVPANDGGLALGQAMIAAHSGTN